MEDFGNIVYVLAAIGWFFWNAYRKSQQKAKSPKKVERRSQPPPSEPKSEPFKSLEDFILQQFDEEKPVKPQMEPVKVKDDGFLHSDLTHSHLAADYKMSQGEMQSHRVQRQVKPLVVEVVEEESLMDRVLPRGFDLQQAVILNAIMERPYK